MSDLYLKPYFNRRNWLLDNAQNLSLNSEELLLCLLIDFLNEQDQTINYEILGAKLSLDKDKVDEIVQHLVTRGLLEIYVTETGVKYDIHHIFELVDEYNEDISDDIFQAFEDSFTRPLSPMELAKLSDFIADYSKEDILEALRSADAYRKLNMSYIEKILKNKNESKS